MPLFMDLHQASDYEVKPTVDEIKRNHIADLAVQRKYDVKFLQYWINEEAGLVFCLMEAPDKESCAAVHREAHGNMPCNVIELQGGDYMTFMGDETKANKFDIVEMADGTLDAGYRIILVADFISITGHSILQENVRHVIRQSHGRLVNRPGSRKTIVFTTGGSAIECASGIIQCVQKLTDQTTDVRIGISAGAPVTAQHDLFADAIQLANRLCDIAQNNQVLISALVKELTEEISLQNFGQKNASKVLNREDEQFLNLLLETSAALLSRGALTVDGLANAMGMSRSRLYRMITALTGCSPNGVIQELRMQKALRLIRDNYGNVAQIAFEAGFSNPSYFAKSFQKRFGMLPFQAAKLSSSIS
ncbi:nickel-binding protein [Parapedobacter sp. DT-150]|uniref:nickel-binding protein n=1 Tax=Parapedobacter sp. DT-150 TaxID=3396162 RepID=UPI003F19948F